MTEQTPTAIEQRLSRKEVARLLAVSVRCTYRRERDGTFPAPAERNPDRWVASQFSTLPVGVQAERKS